MLIISRAKTLKGKEGNGSRLRIKNTLTACHKPDLTPTDRPGAPASGRWGSRGSGRPWRGRSCGQRTRPSQGQRRVGEGCGEGTDLGQPQMTKTNPSPALPSELRTGVYRLHAAETPRGLSTGFRCVGIGCEHARAHTHTGTHRHRCTHTCRHAHRSTLHTHMHTQALTDTDAQTRTGLQDLLLQWGAGVEGGRAGTPKGKEVMW